jgi:sporulation protein YlmC with PRC-barrel domain
MKDVSKTKAIQVITLTAAVVIFFAYIFVGTVFSAEKQHSDKSRKSEIPALAIRATTLIGQDVENDQGEIIAEIEDVIINEEGCIYDVVLSIGELFGIPGQRVAVSFDSLIIRHEWNYRINYKDDGTKQRIPWKLIWTVIYPDKVKELRQKPEYHYDYENPRGSVWGWGENSYSIKKAKQ